MKHFLNIWNMAPTCLWSIRWERKTHTFEDNETFRSLKVSTNWDLVFVVSYQGFAQCISIYDFLQSVIFFFKSYL